MNNKTLFVVATPIGNLQDITLRAVSTLKKVGVVLCEDTRVTNKLLIKFGITNVKLIPFNEFNEDQVIYKVLEILKTEDAALLSDAGTPLISDPGYKLVSFARKKGIRIIPIPGPSAVIAALCASGLPTDKFSFLGFLPKNQGKAKKTLETFIKTGSTIVMYESPYRLLKTLKLITEVQGDINVTIARELTKIHEEFLSGTISELTKKFTEKKPKGEFVILFSVNA